MTAIIKINQEYFFINCAKNFTGYTSERTDYYNNNDSISIFATKDFCIRGSKSEHLITNKKIK